MSDFPSPQYRWVRGGERAKPASPPRTHFWEGVKVAAEPRSRYGMRSIEDSVNLHIVKTMKHLKVTGLEDLYVIGLRELYKEVEFE